MLIWIVDTISNDYMYGLRSGSQRQLRNRLQEAEKLVLLGALPEARNTYGVATAPFQGSPMLGEFFTLLRGQGEYLRSTANLYTVSSSHRFVSTASESRHRRYLCIPEMQVRDSAGYARSTHVCMHVQRTQPNLPQVVVVLVVVRGSA